MAEKLQLWPQIVVLTMMGISAIREIILHGQPSREKYDAARVSFGFMVMFFILAEGGFWKPFGW